MRLCLYAAGLAIAIATPAFAQPAPPATPAPAAADDAADADVAALNRRIAERNAAILQGNADRQASWEQERAAIAAENARQKAAFAAQQAAHEADMAKWRADTAALARATPGRPNRDARPPAPPKAAATAEAAPAKRICHMEAQTGSMIRRTKVCLTTRESNERARDAQALMRGMGTSSCGKPSCE